MNRLFKFLGPALLAGVMTSVHAKLPAPAPVDPAKAAEAKAKKAEAAKKGAEALAKARDRAVENYRQSHGGGMMPAKAEMAAKPKAK